MDNGPKRLYRSTDNRMLGGVCGGLAAYFNVDPTLVRLAFVILTFPGGAPGILAYVVLWIVIPLPPGQADLGSQVAGKAEDVVADAKSWAEDQLDRAGEARESAPPSPEDQAG